MAAGRSMRSLDSDSYQSSHRFSRVARDREAPPGIGVRRVQVSERL